MSMPFVRGVRAHPNDRSPAAVPGGAGAPAAGRSAPLRGLLFWRMAKTDLGRRTLKVVWAVLLLQAVLGAGALVAGILHLRGSGTVGAGSLHLGIGLLLVAMTGSASLATRRLIREIQSSDNAKAVAAGAFAPFVQARFAEWALTAAEHDVAMFTLKGFETNEIADLRHTSQGTVRVQLARIYDKAGVNSRCAFQSMFFEDLLDAEPGQDGPACAPAVAHAAARVVSRRRSEDGSDMLPV